MGPWRELLALLLLGGSSGSFKHSLQYQYVVVSEPSEGLPQFFTVGFVDDQIISYYDSQKKKKVPKVSWMKEVEKEDANYWKEGSDVLEATQQVLQEDLRHVQNRYKQNGGFHTWQTTYGCELQGNRSKGGYSQYGYDGRTFLTFDKETLSWVAPDPLAEITKRNWDDNVRWSLRNKVYLEEECTEWLEKYLSYREKAMLPSTEPPVVTITRRTKDEDGLETHICQIHGFYPKEIDASWRRDGEAWEEETFRGFLVPNADGTYYYWLSIRIDPKERDRYRCHVEHDSLQEPLDLELKVPESTLGVIIGCVVAALLLACVFPGILLVFLRKRKSDYKAATTSDKGSKSSDWGSSSHSFKFVYFAILEPSQRPYHFFIVGYVDGQILAHYDSNSRKIQPRVSWMEKLEKDIPQYWQALTDVARTYDDQHRDHLEFMRTYYNHSQVHMLQGIASCELRGNGSESGFYTEAYNGEARFSLPMVEMENCIELLKKCLSYGNETLLTIETPVVTVSSRTEVEDGMETHVCRVHGFYPREIDASWTRDGEVWLEDTVHESVAPNADGIYHYWLNIQIDPTERDHYRCHVEHDSLQEPLVLVLKVPESNLGLIIGCAVAALVLACVIVGSLIFLRSHSSGRDIVQGATSI